MEQHEAQWDFVYPVSAFMDTYRFPVLANDFYEHYPALELDVVSKEVEGGRRVMMTMNFVSTLRPCPMCAVLTPLCERGTYLALLHLHLLLG